MFRFTYSPKNTAYCNIIRHGCYLYRQSVVRSFFWWFGANDNESAGLGGIRFRRQKVGGMWTVYPQMKRFGKSFAT